MSPIAAACERDGSWKDRGQASGARRASSLLVDDEDSLLGVLAVVMGVTYEVAAVSSGEEAIALLLKNTYDAIVCDLHMVGMNGVAVLEWIRIHRPELAKRFILAGGALRGVVPADVRHLDKPFNMKALLAAVKAVVEVEVQDSRVGSERVREASPQGSGRPGARSV